MVIETQVISTHQQLLGNERKEYMASMMIVVIGVQTQRSLNSLALTFYQKLCKEDSVN